MRKQLEHLYTSIAHGIRTTSDIDLLNSKVRTYKAILKRMSKTKFSENNLQFAARQKQRYEKLLCEANNRLQELGHEQ